MMEGLSHDLEAILAKESQAIPSDRPVLDLARVVPSGREQELENKLKDLEQRSGWRVRLLTRPGPNAGPSEDEIRAAWQLDSKSSLIVVDPTSPNILQFRSGAEVNRLLSRPFFVELQSRYGNMFYVREEGEAAAVMGVVDALVECLETPGGCAVVPGLPSNQYQLTLITSVIGGFIAGYASRLQPEGIVRRKWIWLLVFSPLWGTLFISFGIGPIVTRTSDRIPVLMNTAAFLAAALVFRLSPLFQQSAIDTSILKRSTQERDDGG
ncbi:g3905 [Coccomyxa elongata]